MKKLSFSIPFKKKTKVAEVSNKEVSFIVIDDAAKLEAAKILSKVKLPDSPSLHGLENAYVFADSLSSFFRKKSIRIVQNKKLTKEESYDLNVKTYEELIDQRNAIIGMAENMKPIITNLAGVNIKVGDHDSRIIQLERQIDELQQMLRKVYGKAPKALLSPDKKLPWTQPLKDAAIMINKNYEDDSRKEIREYLNLRAASDQFYDQHEFVYKPNLDKPQLYDNVKKLRAQLQ